MTRQEHIRDTFNLALPVALSQLGHIMVGLVDTYMAVKISEAALSAATVALSMYFPLFMFYIGMSYGFTPLIAQAHGEDDKDKIATILYHAVYINFAIAALITLLLYGGTFLIPYLNQPPEIIDDAITFTHLLMWTVIPVSVFQIIRQFIEGLGHTKQAMFISVMGNLINIVLNILLVKGLFGFPALGLPGVAVATLCARVFMAIAIIVYFFFIGDYKEYIQLLKIQRFKKKMLEAVWGKSYPTGFQMSFEGTAFSVAAILVGMFGTIQLSAHQIALNLASVTYMAASGVAAAATVRVGYLYGQKNHQELKRAGYTAIGMVMVFMAFCSVMFVSFHTILPSLFSEDPEVIKICGWLLWMTAFFQLSDGIQVTSMGALRGISDVKVPSLIAFLAYWVIGIPLGAFFAFVLDWQVYGIWVGLTVGLVIASIVLWRRFYIKANSLDS